MNNCKNCNKETNGIVIGITGKQEPLCEDCFDKDNWHPINIIALAVMLFSPILIIIADTIWDF